MSATGAARGQRWWRSMSARVVAAIVTGILIGVVSPDLGASLGPLGVGFVNLIKMLIGPVIFCTIVHGIASVGDLRQAGRVGVKALVYFEVVTTLALVIGLVVVNLIWPGAGLNVDPASLTTKGLPIAAVEAAGDHPEGVEGFVDFVMRIIPRSFVAAFVDGELLQVVLVSLLFGAALAGLGEAGRPVLEGVEHLNRVFFGIVNLIMKIAPLGALGAMAFTVGRYGLGSLVALAWLMGSFYLTCLLFVFLVLGPILWWTCRVRIDRLLRHLSEELWIVLGTSSSETVLPRLMEKLTRLGCARPVVGLTLPTGYSFNLDGTSIYLTMAAVFVAQAVNVPLSLGDQLGLLAVLLITSKGAAGVTGSGFIVLAATLQSTSAVPVAALTLILGIDRFMSEARALTNVVGNTVATLVVARWENALDLDTLQRTLNPTHSSVPDAPGSLSIVAEHQTETSARS